MGLKKRGSILFRSQSERIVGSEKVVIVRVVPREEDDLDQVEHDLDQVEQQWNNNKEENFLSERRKDSSNSYNIHDARSVKRSSSAKRDSNSRFKKFFGGSGGGGGDSSKSLPYFHTSSLTTINNGIASGGTSMLSHRHSSYYDSDLGDSCNSSEVDSSMPVLLSVRKKINSDSGHDSSYNSSPSTSVRDAGGKGDKNVRNNGQPHHSKSRGGIFRLFHKSATLLFNHPTHELNPNKPYKSAISLSSTKELRQQQQLGARKKNHHHYIRDLNQRRPCVSSSSSSLNSSVLHHHLEHDEAIGEGGQQQQQHPVENLHPIDPRLHSSSNSVISSVGSSNYDSGAFSRTSSPEFLAAKAAASAAAATAAITTSQIHANARRKSSTLGMYAPLSAPSLVLEVCGRTRKSKSGWDISNRDSLPWDIDSVNQGADTVDAAHILACLNAASQPSAIHNSLNYYGILKPEDYHRINSRDNDVSVTIGSNTKLTISPQSLPPFFSKGTNLRRSRSGLPLLGMSGLNQSKCSSNRDSPIKPLRTSSPIKGVNRSKISTVYLSGPNMNSSGGDHNTSKNKPVTRSESFVTLSSTNSAKSLVTCCNERVTVNGQHHCEKKQSSDRGNAGHFHSLSCTNRNFLDATSTEPETFVEEEEEAESQPGSLINV